jgi:ribosome-binding factor A
MKCREKIAYVEEQLQGRIAQSITSDIGDAMASGIVVTRRLLQSK